MKTARFVCAFATVLVSLFQPPAFGQAPITQQIFVPPFDGASLDHSEVEGSAIWGRRTGSASDYNPGVGALHHVSLVGADLVGGTNWYVLDEVTFPIEVTKTGFYRIVFHGRVNGVVLAGRAGEIGHSAQYLSVGAGIYGLGTTEDELRNTLDERWPSALVYVTVEAAKEILNTLFPSGWVARALNVAETVLAVADLIDQLQRLQLLSDRPLGTDGLELYGHLEQGRHTVGFWIKSHNVAATSAGLVASIIDVTASIDSLLLQDFSPQPVPVPNAPVSILPSDGAEDATVHPTLSWSTSSGASSYRLQVSRSSTFSPIVVDIPNVQATSYRLHSLAFNTVYYWRVSANGPEGTSPYSAVRSFTTLAATPVPPPLPVGAGLIEGQTVNVAPNSTVNAEISAPSGYTVVAGGWENAGGPNQLLVPRSLPASSDLRSWNFQFRNEGSSTTSVNTYLTVSRTTIDSLIEGSTVDVAPNSTVNAEISAPSGYTVVAGGWEDTAGGSNQLLVPRSLPANSDLRSWNFQFRNEGSSTTSVNTYLTVARTTIDSLIEGSTVDVASNSTVNAEISAPSGYTVVAGGWENAGGPNQLLVPRSLPANTDLRSWNFQFRNAGSSLTSVNTFLVVRREEPQSQPPISVPPTPTLISPTHGSGGAPPDVTVTWAPSGGADTYRLVLSRDQAFGQIVYDQGGLVGTSKIVPVLDYSTEYFWRVAATNGAGSSTYSEAWSFSTTLAPPTLLSPESDTADISTSPELVWTAVSGASEYLVQVTEVSSFANDPLERPATDTTHVLSGLGLDTTYYWRVKSSHPSSGIESDWSPTWSFTTAATNTATDLAATLAPTDFVLFQNTPNPFNPSTLIRLGVPERSQVKLTVHDLLGREIATLLDDEIPGGFHSAPWTAVVPSGVYIYRIEAIPVYNPSMRFVAVRKMVLIR